MKTKQSIIKKLVYAFIGILLIAITVIQLMRNKVESQDKVYVYDRTEAVSVHVDTLVKTRIQSERSYSGTFEPWRETKINAELQGNIIQIFSETGALVKKGTPLIQLDNSLLKLQLESSVIQISGLENDIARYTILTQGDAIQGIQLEKTELALKTAKVQKEILETQIAKTTIRAPFDGIVTAKLTEVGSFAAPGVPLIQLTDLNKVRFTILIPESDLANFLLNESYQIHAEAFPEKTFEGKVVLIGSKANPGNSYPVQFEISNTKNLDIKAGMTGEVSMSNDMDEEGYLIPNEALIGNSDNYSVYLIKNGKAVLTKVDTQGRVKNKTIVTGGVSEGDIVVTRGIVNLFDGATVEIN